MSGGDGSGGSGGSGGNGGGGISGSSGGGGSRIEADGDVIESNEIDVEDDGGVCCGEYGWNCVIGGEGMVVYVEMVAVWSGGGSFEWWWQFWVVVVIERVALKERCWWRGGVVQETNAYDKV